MDRMPLSGVGMMMLHGLVLTREAALADDGPGGGQATKPAIVPDALPSSTLGAASPSSASPPLSPPFASPPLDMSHNKKNDIQLLRVNYLRGPNIWTYRQVLEVWLDLGELEACP